MDKKELENKKTVLTDIELTRQEQFIEIIGNTIAILMLFAFFLKVVFF